MAAYVWNIYKNAQNFKRFKTNQHDNFWLEGLSQRFLAKWLVAHRYNRLYKDNINI